MTAEHDYEPVLSNDWVTSFALKGRRTFPDAGLATSIAGRIRQALINGWYALIDVTYVQKLITSTEENVRCSWARICRGFYKSLPNNKRLLSDITLSSGLHPVSSVAALGDGTHVVSVCGAMVRILNISTLQTVLSLGDGEVKFAVACATSRRNSYIVISRGRGVCVTRIGIDNNGNFCEVENDVLDSRGVAKWRCLEAAIKLLLHSPKQMRFLFGIAVMTTIRFAARHLLYIV